MIFWIEKFRPADLGQIIGQERVVEVLRKFSDSHMLPHLLVTGPHGTGKSIAVEATLKALYGDSWQDNVTIFQTADMMERGRSYLETDERFMHLYKPDESFLSNLKHAINSYASIRPINAEFKVLWFEDAHTLSQDVQHALRRIMERYSRTCRFVFCTTQASSVIPPISSRCLPLFFLPLSREQILARLKEILQTMGATDTVSDEELGILVAAAGGDLRKAIMYLQVRVSTGTEITPATFDEGETRKIAAAAFIAMQSKDIATAQRRLEGLMIEYGLSAREVLQELMLIVRREYYHPDIISSIADTDYIITHAGNEYLQMNALAAKIVGEVFL
ncbi:MAG TPA: AAA family ATPase [Methanospirillum sp.]|uniref:AAA family ATPase n=1 Tax=Methanospirillum sp. TaxID=45200 RepID=UPI002CD67BB7|nr:AAA family ATPase [Methanospirillum sp.]HWQ65215.1 AAA family ATPase [Methanospirillum sp.]